MRGGWKRRDDCGGTDRASLSRYSISVCCSAGVTSAPYVPSSRSPSSSRPKPVLQSRVPSHGTYLSASRSPIGATAVRGHSPRGQDRQRRGMQDARIAGLRGDAPERRRVEIGAGITPVEALNTLNAIPENALSRPVVMRPVVMLRRLPDRALRKPTPAGHAGARTTPPPTAVGRVLLFRPA